MSTLASSTHDGQHEAEAMWERGQDLAARLEHAAEQATEEAERERLGDLADALRGI